MRTFHRCLAVLAVGLSLWVPPAMAQATRTWVSGVGDDVNPCSRTAPCKTFAGAISKTAPGGEIDVLDSGGFGAVTITKPITIDGGGVLAGTLASGVVGFTINTTGQVNLRNLFIQGAGTTLGIVGIQWTGGAGNLHIKNVIIEGFSQACVSVSPTAAVLAQITDSTLNNCGAAGLSVVPNGGSATVTLDRSTVQFTSGTGVLASGAAATVRLTNSTVLDNGVGLSAASGASIISFNNNRLKGNTSDGDAPTVTYYQR